MLKIKDSVDLKKLEKYGFVFYSRTITYYYKIDCSEFIQIPANKDSKFYKQIRLFIDDEYYECWTGEETFDTLYDLIKDGLVEKVGE